LTVKGCVKKGKSCIIKARQEPSPKRAATIKSVEKQFQGSIAKKPISWIKLLNDMSDAAIRLLIEKAYAKATADQASDDKANAKAAKAKKAAA